MRNDLAAKEREFIAELAAETGRDLAAWMDEIDSAGLGDRNATIDWLKERHVYFSRASRAMWLERIHHNGGRPIFEGAPPDVVIEPAAGLQRSAAGAREAAGAPNSRTASQPIADAETRHVPPPRAASADEIEVVLAHGKAFRPLAAYLLGEIRKAVPGLVVGVERNVLLLGAARTFGAIEVRAKEVRLGLALGAVDDPRFVPGRIAGAPATIGAVAALTDARTIDAALLALARAAAESQI